MRGPAWIVVALAAAGCAPSPRPAASPDEAASLAVEGAAAARVVHPAAGTPAPPIDLAAGELARTHARADAATSPEERALLRLLEADLAARRRHVLRVQLSVLEDAMGSASAHATAPLERRRSALLASDRALEAETLTALAAVADDRARSVEPFRPAALARLASSLRDAGRPAEALARWRSLAARYPAAREAAGAHLALAEAAFAGERLAESVRECDAVLAFGESASRVSALYLKAWSLRGLGDARRPGALQDAVAALREILRLAPTSIGPSDAAIADAAEEELYDLAAHGRGRTASPALAR